VEHFYEAAVKLPRSVAADSVIADRPPVSAHGPQPARGCARDRVRLLPHRQATDLRGPSHFYARSVCTTSRRRTIRSDGGVAHSTGRLSIAATCSHRADASSLTTATDYDTTADGTLADGAASSSIAAPPRARVGRVRTASYGTPSRHIANKMRARRRAKATTAILFPRRCAMPCAQRRRSAVRGSFDSHTRQAAWTSKDWT
jgi:hypothetical protein